MSVYIILYLLPAGGCVIIHYHHAMTVYNIHTIDLPLTLTVSLNCWIFGDNMALLVNYTPIIYYKMDVFQSGMLGFILQVLTMTLPISGLGKFKYDLPTLCKFT